MSKKPAIPGQPDNHVAVQLNASVEQIESRIFVIRGQKVMLDADLAELYGVETKVLNQVVKRNLDRFPDDFMFQLSTEEFANLKSKIGISSLRSQIVTSNIPSGRGGRRHLPYVFTEHGALMLGNVLKSARGRGQPDGRARLRSFARAGFYPQRAFAKTQPTGTQGRRS